MITTDNTDATTALFTLTAFLTMVQQVWYEEKYGTTPVPLLHQASGSIQASAPHAAPSDDDPAPMANPTDMEELFEVYTRGLISDEELISLIRTAVRQLSGSSAL